MLENGPRPGRRTERSSSASNLKREVLRRRTQEPASPATSSWPKTLHLTCSGPSLAPTTTAYSSASSTGGYMRVRARCVRSRWWAITGVTTAQEEGWRGCGLNSIIGFETPFPACLQHGASQTQLLVGKRDCPSRCSRRAHGVLGKGRPHKIPKKKSAAYLGATR